MFFQVWLQDYFLRIENSLECAAAASFINGLAGKAVQKKLGLHITSMDLLDEIPNAMKPFDKIK